MSLIENMTDFAQKLHSDAVYALASKGTIGLGIVTTSTAGASRLESFQLWATANTQFVMAMCGIGGLICTVVGLAFTIYLGYKKDKRDAFYKAHEHARQAAYFAYKTGRDLEHDSLLDPDGE